ncbi:MAG TPA: carboxypeptidase regulatory-like domain-containing protein [Vicinamibacterales bacterium]|nr:carboxypeptidase regulatory-like domain-containing protein [Vicinamibacterales bacterium]
MNIHIRAALAVALILVVSVPAFAQGRGSGMRAGDSMKDPKVAPWRGNAQVAGKVTDDTGKPIENAKVAFVFVSSNSGFFATTKKNGEFSAKDIKGGEWRVQVDAANFITVRQPLTIADTKNAPISVTLKRDNSPELLTKAEALFKAGQNAEARTEYLTVLAAHPELTAINRAIAFTYGREKNHVEALKYLDLAIASNPNDAILLQLAAASATQLSDYPRTMAYLAKIDDAMLTEPSMLSDAAVNLVNKQRSADAILILDRVIVRFPTDADAYFYRGFAKMQASRDADAKPDLEKYVAIAPAGAPQIAKAKELLATIK